MEKRKMSEISESEPDGLYEDEETVVYEAHFPRVVAVMLLLAVAAKLMLFSLPWVPPRFSSDLLGHLSGEVDDDSPPAATQSSFTSSLSSAAEATSTTIRPSETPAPSPGIVQSWPYQSFRTENFTAPDMNISKTGDTSPGLLFFGPRGRGTQSEAPMIMTEDNELIWHGPKGTNTNMMLQELNGTQHITFWQGESAFSYGRGYGAVYVLNSSYDLVYRVCPQDMNIVTEVEDDKHECYLDMHESAVTTAGTLVVTGYNVTRKDLSVLGGPSDAWVFDSMFYEIDVKTQEILFSWSVWDHLDQIPLKQTKYPLVVHDETLGTSQASPFDFFHINSVQPLEDGFLVNSRHTWSVYKVSRDGNVEWRLQGDDGGDFDMEEGGAFSWQHDVRAVNITPTTLQLNIFSNANSERQEEVKESVGLNMFLDLEHHLSLPLRTLIDPDDIRHSGAMGSWQNLANDHVLIGYGKDAVIKEFSHTNQVVWTAQFGDSKNDAAGEVASYRVYKFDWSAKPSAPPKIVAEHEEGADATIIYASWNGATPDVFDNWFVEAGSASDALAPLDPVPAYKRMGFETVMRVPGRERFYRVTARLRTSSVHTSLVTEAG